MRSFSTAVRSFWIWAASMPRGLEGAGADGVGAFAVAGGADGAGRAGADAFNHCREQTPHLDLGEVHEEPLGGDEHIPMLEL